MNGRTTKGIAETAATAMWRPFTGGLLATQPNQPTNREGIVRIHTDKLSAVDIYAAANFSAAVRVQDLTEHGSLTRARAFKFYLLGSSSFRPNQRDYSDGDYAATWDQWGIVIGHLFARDPAAHFGRHSYRSAEDFHYKTGHRFVPGFITPDMQHKRHRWEPNYDYTASCACGAIHRWDGVDYRPIESSMVAA